MEPAVKKDVTETDAGAPSTVQASDSTENSVDKSEKIAEPQGSAGPTEAADQAQADAAPVQGEVRVDARGEMSAQPAAEDPKPVVTGAVHVEPNDEIIEARHAHRQGDSVWVRAVDWHATAAVTWGQRCYRSERPEVVVYDRATLDAWK
jgi:hypothetical protein